MTHVHGRDRLRLIFHFSSEWDYLEGLLGILFAIKVSDLVTGDPFHPGPDTTLTTEERQVVQTTEERVLYQFFNIFGIAHLTTNVSA